MGRSSSYLLSTSNEGRAEQFPERRKSSSEGREAISLRKAWSWLFIFLNDAGRAKNKLRGEAPREEKGAGRSGVFEQSQTAVARFI